MHHFNANSDIKYNFILNFAFFLKKSEWIIIPDGTNYSGSLSLVTCRPQTYVATVTSSGCWVGWKLPVPASPTRNVHLLRNWWGNSYGNWNRRTSTAEVSGVGWFGIALIGIVVLLEQNSNQDWRNIYSSRPGLTGRHFADDIFKCIFMNEKFCILILISLKFVPKGPIDNKPALVQVMDWCWTGDKPLPEPMLIQFTDAYIWH